MCEGVYQNDTMRKVESKGTPTIFVVNSPLQVLCAFEAIEYFSIKTFLFVLSIFESPRNKQLFQLMEEKKLPFMVERLDRLNYNLGLKSIVKKYIIYNRYHRAFVGDEESMAMKFYAYKYLAPCSTIAYLDDGNRTLNMLKGVRFINNTPWERKREKRFLQLTMTKDTKTYFTIYHDIENTKYRLIPNDFTSLIARRSRKNGEKKNIYFIGTNIDIYCQKIGLDINLYWHYLCMAFSKIKRLFPNEEIIYIPHGRDVSPITEKICYEQGVLFKRIDTSIEYYMINQNYLPVAFFSYTSTALFTLKKMFPETDSFNILCDGMEITPLYQTYIDFSNYFLKHGIMLLLQSEINTDYS